MALNYQTALVTGGAGFIGSHLTEALVARGCEVAVIDDLSTGRLANLTGVRQRIRFFQGDIRDRELLQAAVAGCEVVFHLAAVVSVTQTVDDPLAAAGVNEMGTLEVLEAARHNGVRKVVFSSSSAVYGDLPGLPKTEAMPVAPQSPYAVQKLAGEWYARLYGRLYGLPAVSLRYFNVYGPRQDPSSPYSGVISLFMQRAAEGAPPTIYGDGRQYRDFVFVKDVVAANLLAADAGRANGAAFNIGTGVPTTVNRMWEMIRNLAGGGREPVHAAARPGDIRESVADIGRAGADLGFQPVFALPDGLAATFDWYRGKAPVAGEDSPAQASCEPPENPEPGRSQPGDGRECGR